MLIFILSLTLRWLSFYNRMFILIPILTVTLRWLSFYNRMFAMLDPDEARKVHERLEVGVIHPIEYTILMPHVGMELGALRNKDGLMTERKAGYDVGAVDWKPVVKQMIKDLQRGNAWWRQDSLGRAQGSPDDGRDWWVRHGAPCYSRHSPEKANRLGKKAAEGEARPHLLNVWNAGPHDEPLNNVKLYKQECIEAMELVESLDKDSPEKRAAAGFGTGPAVLIDTLKKRRPYMIEAEGMLSDGTRRWVNVSFKEKAHPSFKNPFPELVLHLGKRMGTDAHITWHVVRRENLSSWIMPRGESQEGVLGAGLPTREQIAEEYSELDESDGAQSEDEDPASDDDAVVTGVNVTAVAAASASGEWREWLRSAHRSITSIWTASFRAS